MNNYYASEHALTKATKTLWANKPKANTYPPRDFEPIVYTPKPALNVKSYGERKNTVKISQDDLENFQQNRLFQIIRNDRFRN